MCKKSLREKSVYMIISSARICCLTAVAASKKEALKNITRSSMTLKGKFVRRLLQTDGVLKGACKESSQVQHKQATRLRYQTSETSKLPLNGHHSKNQARTVPRLSVRLLLEPWGSAAVDARD